MYYIHIKKFIFLGEISALPKGIQIVDKGKKEFVLINKKSAQVNAEIEIEGLGTVLGTYKGDKTEVLEKNTCLCFSPIYKLVATNQGSFKGVTKDNNNICYDGQLFESNFDHITTNNLAIFFIEKQVKYEGCFKNGNRHGQGTQWNYVET